MIGYRAHPEAWLLVVGLVGGYAYLLSAWGPRFAPQRGDHHHATRSQKLTFAAGAAVLSLGTNWPLHDLGENYLYSAHMVQHLAFQLVAAPLLILGTPAWLLRALLRPRWLTGLVRTLAKPIVAIVIVNVFVGAAHTPGWVEASVANGGFHFVTHVLWMAVGMVMWWPVLSPLPELPHYSYPGRMAYLFSHSLVPTVPASFLTFASTPLYPSYATAPRLWEFMTPLQDLQIAGLLMKLGGGLLLWGVIAVLWFAWAREDASGGPDVLYWRDYDQTHQTPELLIR